MPSATITTGPSGTGSRQEDVKAAKEPEVSKPFGHVACIHD